MMQSPMNKSFGEKYPQIPEGTDGSLHHLFFKSASIPFYLHHILDIIRKLWKERQNQSLVGFICEYKIGIKISLYKCSRDRASPALPPSPKRSGQNIRIYRGQHFYTLRMTWINNINLWIHSKRQNMTELSLYSQLWSKTQISLSGDWTSIAVFY